MSIVTSSTPLDLEERLQSRPLVSGDLSQAVFHQDAILLEQGNEIGHRTEGDQIEIPPEVRYGTARLAEQHSRTHQQVEDDSRSAEAGEREAGVGDDWVEDRQGGRPHGRVLMMVANDQLETETPRFGDLRMRRGAAVGGDDQPSPAFAELAKRRHLEPVAVAHAVGNVQHRFAPELAQEQHELRARRDSIHVVVAVNRDPLPAPYGFENPTRRRLHVPEEHRRAETSRQRGIEEVRGDRRPTQTAVHEQPRQQRPDAELALERSLCAGVGLDQRPAVRRSRHRACTTPTLRPWPAGAA